MELLCIDDQLFWVDSCGNQGDKVQDCKHGCGDGECIGEPTPDVTIPTEQDGLDEPDEKSAANGEAVTFGTGAKSGGCSTSSSNPATAGLLLLLLMGLAFLRRQQTT